MTERKCSECAFAITVDYGYSNYTVEGTTVYCSRGRFPLEDGFDRWYGEEEKDKAYAARCDVFKAGEPVGIDCDREDMNSKASNIAELWGAYATADVPAAVLGLMMELIG